MAQTTTTETLQEMIDGPLSRGEFPELVDLIYGSYRTVDEAHHSLDDLVEEAEQASGDERRQLREKAGILASALGDYPEAVEQLEPIADRPEASHFLGRAYMELRQMDSAEEALQRGRQGDDDFETDMLLVDIYCHQRNPEPARELCEQYEGTHGGGSRWLYAMGRVLETEGRYGEAMEHYENAIDLDPENRRALFRLALNCDLNGEDERAIELYRECASLEPTFLGALMNLGVLYEDQQEFEKAAECYRRVLAIDPTHQQARMYVKDAEASVGMYTTEEQRRIEAQREKAKDRPVSDFDLSTRSEHVLEELDVATLGELAELNEDQLMEIDNFGESSLTEIKQVLARHNLSLSDETSADAEVADSGLSDVQRESSFEGLDTPVEDLELSTRCNQAMEKLEVDTVGDLIEISEDELLDLPNFGRTSVSEIKTKLAEMGLGLREE
ncbi:MAG: DNA-directed RNA polymerase subunit alpha C-terminal domain-containing protein [Candidatus Brocadiia bacterium]